MTISLNPTPEQRQIVASAQKVLAEQFPPSRLRGARAGGADLARVQTLAELGAFGLGTPEAVGGAGFGLVEEVLLFEQLGRHLVTPVALAATLGARAALAAGQTELASAIVSGRQPMCVANALRPFALDELDGVSVHLLDCSDGALAVLWNDSGLVLLRTTCLRDLHAVSATDRSVLLQRATLAEEAVLCRLGAAGSPLAAQASLLVSAQLLGMAHAACDMAVDYAKVRQQFGQPIGAFQAIKHRCADMAIGVEVLRAQLAFAALALSEGWPDARLQIDACRLLAVRCALDNARGNIQVHGGIGFTAECDAHHYLLRSHGVEHLGGPLSRVEERIVHASA
jgi:alkylation response protein AidB-like acyl-CoA dehydrogenase